MIDEDQCISKFVRSIEALCCAFQLSLALVLSLSFQFEKLETSSRLTKTRCVTSIAKAPFQSLTRYFPCTCNRF